MFTPIVANIYNELKKSCYYFHSRNETTTLQVIILPPTVVHAFAFFVFFEVSTTRSGDGSTTLTSGVANSGTDLSIDIEPST